MKIHTVLSAHSDCYPYIDQRAWNTFIYRADILDDLFKMKDCEVIWNLVSEDDSLNRHQFLAAIIVLCEEKYL